MPAVALPSRYRSSSFTVTYSESIIDATTSNDVAVDTPDTFSIIRVASIPAFPMYAEASNRPIRGSRPVVLYIGASSDMAAS